MVGQADELRLAVRLTQSGNLESGLLLFCHACAVRGRRELQHSQGLPFAQAGDLNDPSVREFQRVVMGIGLVQIDLPEPGHLLSVFPN